LKFFKAFAFTKLHMEVILALKYPEKVIKILGVKLNSKKHR